MWTLSNRGDQSSAAIADRHYNRQKIGSPQFVPPGRCVVLRWEASEGKALWVTSWPFAEYVKHDWAGAWVNSLFRNEGAGKASEMIRSAVAITRGIWNQVPERGLVTFVSPTHVKPTVVRGSKIYGYCYLRAGFRHVGFTKAGLWAWQLLESEMPDPVEIQASQVQLF